VFDRDEFFCGVQIAAAAQIQPETLGAAVLRLIIDYRAARDRGRAVRIQDGFRIRAVDVTADPRWDTFVEKHPDGLVYHHSRWLHALERENGCRALALACETADGSLVGILPLFATRGVPLMRGALTGPRLASLPRTPIAGPLAADRDVAAALVHEAAAYAEGAGMQLQLKVDGPRLEGLAPDLVGIPWRESYVLGLPSEPDTLRFGNARTHNRIKWAIGKAERAGVAVRPADHEEELRAWYALYLETMRDHLVPPRPYRLFRTLWEVMKPAGLFELVLAEERASRPPRLLAGSIFLMLGRTVFYAFNGRQRSSLALRPNDLIIWAAIHDATRRGFRRFDLGEVATGQRGLAKFKQKWGAEGTRLYRYYTPPVAAQEVPDADVEPHRIAAALWQRMPLRATALAGDIAYHYL
jgi:CelD/BcsL family acetyltransferase involved in cellulose biosynthesis